MKLLQMFKKLRAPAAPGLLSGVRGIALGGTFTHRGLMAQPVIVVRGSDGANLIDTITATERNGTYFGPVPLGSSAEILRTFTIENEGAAVLTLGCIGIEGSGAEEFEVTAYPEPVLLPGSSTTFTIRFRASRMGAAIALVLVPSNDPTEHPYVFEVEGSAYTAAFSRA